MAYRVGRGDLGWGAVQPQILLLYLYCLAPGPSQTHDTNQLLINLFNHKRVRLRWHKTEHINYAKFRTWPPEMTTLGYASEVTTVWRHINSIIIPLRTSEAVAQCIVIAPVCLCV